METDLKTQLFETIKTLVNDCVRTALLPSEQRFMQLERDLDEARDMMEEMDCKIDKADEALGDIDDQITDTVRSLLKDAHISIDV